MLLIGAHLINKGTFDPVICQQIQQSNSLIVGTNTWYGAGAYAYNAERVPVTHRNGPMVVFQVRHLNQRAEILDVCVPGHHHIPDSRFFLIRVPGVAIGTAIAVAILGFVNCPGFSPYPGTLYYV